MDRFEESTFEDDLGHAFDLAGRAASPCDNEQAFQRAGRFQLVNFHLGRNSATAELKYFSGGAEIFLELKDCEWVQVAWELDQLRLLINEMPEGEERAYLRTVEEALSTYSWLQWAVQDTGTHMRPDGDLSEIGRRTRQLMETLQPIRNSDALIPERRPRPREHAPA